MGIRTKIAIWFILLTVSVISLVSYWGAQKLGFTVDSSDIIHLKTIKSSIVNQLKIQQNMLDEQASEISQALVAVSFNKDENMEEFSSLISSIKDKLELDYIEVFYQNKPLFCFTNIGSVPNKTSTNLGRLANSGPFSYKGYIISKMPIPNNPGCELIIGTKPKLTMGFDEVFCIFDEKGIMASSGFLSNYSQNELSRINDLYSTQQVTINSKLYRLRSFNLSSSEFLIIGYSAQLATLAKSEINNMMIRLALLEILGFLILGYFWSKRIFEPMKTLQSSIENVSQGKWQEIPEEVTNNSYDEIGSVAKSFNQMVNQLSSARENLIEIQKKLAIKDKMATLGRFSAGIAHEINNPLGTILMSAGIIKESVENNITVEKEDIDAIIEEVKRCRDIIENLRTYTKKIEPNLTRCSFVDFMKGIQQFLLSKFPQYKQQISFTITDDLDSFINVDKKAMQQVFVNLVKNAIEAVEENLLIEIIANTNNDFCCIEILDNGKGFECNPEHIFEPLFTTKAQGTGLGLVICQAIIEGHHGSIQADRVEESNKTRVSIKLPQLEIQKQDKNLE